MNTLRGFYKGYVELTVKTNDMERFLNMCTYNNIPFWDIIKQEEDYHVSMFAKDVKKCKHIFRKTKSKLRISKKHGLPFVIFRWKKRKAFLFGTLLASIILILMTQFIWNIHITGNTYYHSKTIERYLDELDLLGIVPKKQVDCHDISEKLRAQFPKIIWVSTKIKGTNLQIEIKENLNEVPVDANKEKSPCDIIATKDGRVVEIITRSGAPKVIPGDECKKGDVLVSSRLEILDDSKEPIRYDYVASDADIKIQTTYSYFDEFELAHKVKQYDEKIKKSWYLRFFDYYVQFSSKDHQKTADMYNAPSKRMITETIPFPIDLDYYTVKNYTWVNKTYTKNQATSLANEHFEQFKEKLIEKGVQILENNVKIYISGSACVTKGELIVIESTGKEQPANTEELLPGKEAVENE